MMRSLPSDCWARTVCWQLPNATTIPQMSAVLHMRFINGGSNEFIVLPPESEDRLVLNCIKAVSRYFSYSLAVHSRESPGYATVLALPAIPRPEGLSALTRAFALPRRAENSGN